VGTAGNVAAIVGPSGSGKSTLLRLLAGIDPPSAGTLTIFGIALERASSRQLDRHRTEQVAIVDQHYWRAMSPYLPIRETVALPLALRGVGPREGRSRTDDLLGRLGLADRAGALPRELSGGERQRVAIAAALAARPGLLLADEPTGELDDDTARSVLATLRDLVRVEQATAVVVTHDPLVEQVADRVVYLADGRVVAERSGDSAERAIDGRGWLAPTLGVMPERPTARLPASTEPDAVRLERVTRVYGSGGRARTVLADLTAQIAQGSMHAVVGPSGSGKTTLLRLVTGLDRPDRGRVVTLGRDVGAMDAEESARFRARRLGIVVQAPRLIPFLTATEIVELGLELHGVPPWNRQRSTTSALDRVGLAHLADRRVQELSTGEHVRTAIALAVASGAELLVLDEPTAALDRANAREIAQLLADLVAESRTVLVATHDRELIAHATGRLDLRTG
jgi:ABC-type lipoprotein export system ATPase subunit